MQPSCFFPCLEKCHEYPAPYCASTGRARNPRSAAGNTTHSGYRERPLPYGRLATGGDCGCAARTVPPRRRASPAAAFPMPPSRLRCARHGSHNILQAAEGGPRAPSDVGGRGNSDLRGSSGGVASTMRPPRPMIWAALPPAGAFRPSRRPESDCATSAATSAARVLSPWSSVRSSADSSRK